jgi:hypothetical protein
MAGEKLLFCNIVFMISFSFCLLFFRYRVCFHSIDEIFYTSFLVFEWMTRIVVNNVISGGRFPVDVKPELFSLVVTVKSK